MDILPWKREIVLNLTYRQREAIKSFWEREREKEKKRERKREKDN